MVRTRNDDLHARRGAPVHRAAATGFARKGIHQTTMQEICETSGLSAGALYRCFPTEYPIIVAFAEEERTETAKLLSHLNSSPNMIAALTEIVPQLVDGLTDENYGRLALEAAAEATRNPAVEAVFARNETELCALISDALHGDQTGGYVDPKLDRDSAVLLLVALFDGIAGRGHFSGDRQEPTCSRCRSSAAEHAHGTDSGRTIDEANDRHFRSVHLSEGSS